MKREKIWFRVLIVFSILAAIKMLFQNYSLDEEYQVVMSYRNVLGDHLFAQMWEPHQTSSFLCTPLIWLYTAIFHTTTGLVIYLRVCGTLIHLAISSYFYHVCCHFLDKTKAILLVLIYFDTIPKLISIPEFGGMQVWFYTLMVLFWVEAYFYDWKKNLCYVGMGFAMAAEVLSYPSSLILFPFFITLCILFPRKKNKKACIYFTITCTACGLLYLGYLFITVGMQTTWQSVNYILSTDLTHDLSSTIKLLSVGKDLLILIAFLTATYIISAGIAFARNKWKAKQNKDEVCMLDRETKSLQIGLYMIVISCAIQLFYWVVLNKGYEYLQLHIFVTIVYSLVLCFIRHRNMTEIEKLLFGGVVGSILLLVSVMYFTDLPLLNSISHSFTGAVLGLALISIAFETQNYWKKGFLVSVLIIWCATTLVGKGYTLRGGGDYNNVLESRGVLKYGPGIGTVADYMGAYIYNCNYEDWKENIPEGSKVLLATDCVQSVSTSAYLFCKDVQICHYSIVDPTAYDERLLTYWTLYPEKQPDIIAIDCWYGEPLFTDDSWIMQYIENEFGYTRVQDGRYVRFYYK